MTLSLCSTTMCAISFDAYLSAALQCAGISEEAAAAVRVVRDQRSVDSMPDQPLPFSTDVCFSVAALQGAGVSEEAAAAVRVVRDHRSVNAMHSAALEGPGRFVAAAAAPQVSLEISAGRCAVLHRTAETSTFHLATGWQNAIPMADSIVLYICRCGISAGG